MFFHKSMGKSLVNLGQNMETIGNPKTWAPPYINTKDCTQGFCSLSCPQWCYIIFPPPPPPFAFPNDNSQTNLTFSPLVIAIIGVLASAFILVTYYAIISTYCGKSEGSRARRIHSQSQDEDIEEEQGENPNQNDPSHQHEPWLVTTQGLDEGLINKITLVKYKKGDGLIGSSDCSVCLGEFNEDETLRLLPKCSHAFHVACIDTWLKSHSNCPLCRASIISSFAQPIQPQLHTIVVDHSNNMNQHPQDNNGDQPVNVEMRSNREEGDMGVLEQSNGNLPKAPFRVFSDLGEGLRQSSMVDNTDDEMGLMMRRSLSMDHSHGTRVSISNILRTYKGDGCQEENYHNQIHDQSQSQCQKQVGGESSSNSSSGSGVLQCVMCSAAMKRSFSGGRFLFRKNIRENTTVIPE